MTAADASSAVTSRAVVAWLAISVAGCGASQAPSGPATASDARPAVSRVTSDKLVAGALAAVSKLDDFEEQRAYEQAFDRLTQWSHQSAVEVPSWRIDPLISALPERLREVIALCSIEGLSQEECAALRGCSRRAVEGRLYRARQELAEICGGSRG